MTAILYSFRRCPYAMRARLAIASAGLTPEHREILLRDKAPEFLAASPKGTVPVVVDGQNVIEESLDIMNWALIRNDPETLLNMPPAGHGLIYQLLFGVLIASRTLIEYHGVWLKVGSEKAFIRDRCRAQEPKRSY